MIEITTKRKYDLNNMNVAAQNIQLGDFLSELSQNTSGSTGSVISGSSKFGDDTNYAKFDTDGTLTLSGSARVWDDLFFPLTAGKQGALDQPAFSTTEVAYMFPINDATQVIYIVAQMPHRWATGTNIYPHVHWKQHQSGSPVFKMEYKWFDIGETVPSSYQTVVMANRSIQWTSGSIHQLSSASAPIVPVGITGVSSMLLIKLYREDSAYPGTVATYQFDIHILIDSLGSNELYIK